MFLMMILALSGCRIGEEIREAREAVDGVTNTLVVEGIFIGVATPEDDTLALLLEQADWDSEGVIRMFLADASNVDDLVNAPIEGAEIKLHVAGTPKVALVDEGEGLYTQIDGISYDTGSLGTIDITDVANDRTASVARVLPAEADVDIPFDHSVNQAIEVDLRDYDYDAALSIVIDLQRGEVVYSDEPQSIEALYDMTHDGEVVDFLEIPSRVFNEKSLYAVGVAGMMIAEADDMEGVNTALSSFMVGQTNFYPVCTLGETSGINLCDQL